MRTTFHRARAFVCFLLLVCSVLAPAQPNTSADSIRIARLASLGKLWGTVKYFHPYLAYRDIDWDAALVAAIPKVHAAETVSEFAAAVQDMLDQLGDPVTRVIPKTMAIAPSQTKERHPVARFTPDSILIITITRYGDLADFFGVRAKVQALVKDFPKARAIIFDLRSPTPLSESELGAMAFFFTFSELSRYLSTRSLAAPGQRSRMHVGFAPQDGFTSGDYYSAFYTSDGERFSPADGATDQPVMFLVNAHAELPPVALALQSAGKSAIIAEGSASDAAIVKTQQMYLSDSVQVTIRLSELIDENGNGGFHAEVMAPAHLTGQEDTALQMALALARQDDFKTAAHTRNPLPARAAPPAERAYREMLYPALEYRLMAAFRIWTVINYFFPYKDLMGEDWDAVLEKFIPKMQAARDSLAYTLAVAEMVTHIHDSHGVVLSEVLQNYFGVAVPPIIIRMIENVPVVTGYIDATAAQAAGIEIGDVILQVDGEAAKARIERLARYIAASTPQALRRVAANRFLSGGDSSMATLVVRDRFNRVKEVRLLRQKKFVTRQTDRVGDIFRLLPENIGYVDLHRLPATMVDSMLTKFRNMKAIIFDMRGYPQGTAWPIAPRLTEKNKVAAALFQRRILLSPAAHSGEIQEQTITERFVQYLPPTTQWRYGGKTVMLIDERAISQAEHTGLFFEAANGTKFIGSHTTGANGDVTSFYVPGGIQIYFTGQGVRHADGRQLQRLGLVPDVAVTPTIAGIRSGRDEVLEKAIEYIEKEMQTTMTKKK